MTVRAGSGRLVILLGALVATAGLLAVRTIRTPASSAAETKGPPAPSRLDIEEIGWMRLDGGPLPPVSMVGMNAAGLRAAYRNLYRLKPDRRVLYAFEEVDRVLARRRQPATLSLRFASSRWELRLGADEIGTLSEIPSFEEEMRLLREFARQRAARYARTWNTEEVPELSSLTPAINQGGITEIVSAMRELDRLAERRPDNARILAAAARGTVWLDLLSYDTLQLKDPIIGHALALLVLAQAVAPETLREEEALLDLWIGYVAESEKVGGSLADNDPVRAYVMADRVGLEAAASAAAAPAHVRYLYLMQSNSVLDRAPWFERFRDSP